MARVWHILPTRVVVTFQLAFLLLGQAAPTYQRKIFASPTDDASTCFEDWYLQEKDDTGNVLFRAITVPSATACLERITLDTSVTVDTVKSIWNLFDANYAFYNYAKNPLDSSPLNNPLRWTIYNGTSGGQVFFSRRFEDLIERVESNGANLFTILEMCDIIAKARDSHTGNPLSFVNNAVLKGVGLVLLDMNEFNSLKEDGSSLLPPRYLTLQEMNGNTSIIQVYPTLDRKETIKSIQGVNAMEYMQELVSNTALGIVSSYKARGSRMQAFLSKVVDKPPFIFDEPRAYDFRNLPECMNVEFESGLRTQWCFALNVPARIADATVEELITVSNTIPEDGPFKIFEEAVKKGVGSRPVTNYPVEDILSDDSGPSSKASRQSQESANPLNWTFFRTKDQDTINEYGTDVAFAITSIDDATILKFEAFLVGNVTEIAKFCKWLYDFGEERGSSKLIIDLTNNQGGLTMQAYALTQCLYPEASFEQISIPYTKRLSDVVQLNQNLLQAASTLLKALDTVDLGKILNSDINGTITMLQEVLSIHQGLVLLTTGYSNQIDYQKDVSTISRILEDVTKTQKLDPSILRVLRDLMSNTWLDNVRSENSPATFGQPSFTTVIQGGEPVKIATDFVRVSPDDYKLFQNSMEGRMSPFSSYILMGNGLSGSSSALFEFGTLQHAYLNPDSIPAISITYGCSGNKESCPISQYQGGTVKNGQNENMLMYNAVGKGLALAELVTTLSDIGGDATIVRSGEEYINALNEYAKSVPKPPKTATSAYTSFRFTFFSAMTKVAGDNSLPAEYFDIPPNGYIPYWPPWYRLNNLYATDAILPVYESIINGSYG
ncbi:hypothetical protein M9434_001537 [Picochlorum sp. BPE23]|nr:hypothetical protein M9434_001537 [Picochlorum sp. BPE23]